MKVIMIAALTHDRVIGKGNKLPWHIPEDFKRFKALTTGHTIIMGRKTFESLGRTLPNRHNIVISRTLPSSEGVEVCKSLPEALAKAADYRTEAFIIGGASVYEQGLPYADMMYLSWVKKRYEGDAYFPEFDENEWSITELEEFADFTFVAYQRKVPPRHVRPAELEAPLS